MAKRDGRAKLTDKEKSIVKALLAKGKSQQNIIFLINLGREATINQARIAEVKTNDKIVPASEEELNKFDESKASYDHKTKLNLIDHEHLIRAREAMTLAVQGFNNPNLRFKAQTFTILACVAWTYLLQAFFIKKNINFSDAKGRTSPLSKMITQPELTKEPGFTEGLRKNLVGIIKLRNQAEHKLLGSWDRLWFKMFQACCLNFDKMLCKWFGQQLSLAHDLSLALQFSKVDLDQLAARQKYDLPADIQAIDDELKKDLTEEDLADADFAVQLIYTLVPSSKLQADGENQNPTVPVDAHLSNDHPYKPGQVVDEVRKRTGKIFSQRNHTQAWKKYEVRPKGGDEKNEKTKKEYCVYNPTHKAYSYSEEWIECLCKIVKDDEKFAELKRFNIRSPSS